MDKRSMPTEGDIVKYCYNPNTGLCGHNYSNMPCQSPCMEVFNCVAPTTIMDSCGIRLQTSKRACRKALKAHKARVALASFFSRPYYC